MTLNVDHTQKFKSDYEDILASRRNQSDLRWVAREWEEDVVYKYKKALSNGNLFQKVKNSPRVQEAIAKEVSKGQKEKNVRKNVDKMLTEMGHDLDIGTIRKFGLFIPKIMKAIYQSVYVNRSGIQKLKKQIPETPVIFLPTHRSYADFLLISYVAFHYNLPFPVIAAGMDFMSMAIVGDMLRGAGAFYIKRSFMNDELYSALFKEYVQTVFCGSGHPVEFFLEGTRSRSGKSLPPKLGLLSSIVECWITGRVPDVCIVPISISYNRTLEESLYAHELLGVPKPKESTSGLLKAMHILKENYGHIYFYMGDPISMNDYLAPRISRHITASSPPHLVSVSEHERESCESLSLHILYQMQNNFITSVWSLACHVFLGILWRDQWSLSYDLLLEKVTSYARMAKALGARVEGFESSEPINEHLKRQLKVHTNMVFIDNSNNVHIRPIENGNASRGRLNKDIFSDERVVSSSLLHIMLQHYANQSLHIFVRPAIIEWTLRNFPMIGEDELYSKFKTLTTLFSQEFVFVKGQVEKDFKDTRDFLVSIGRITINKDYISLNSEKESIADLLKPFFVCYKHALLVAGDRSTWVSNAEFASHLQSHLKEVAMETRIYSCLSLDTCRHACKALVKIGALNKNADSHLQPDFSKLMLLKPILGLREQRIHSML